MLFGKQHPCCSDDFVRAGHLAIEDSVASSFPDQPTSSQRRSPNGVPVLSTPSRIVCPFQQPLLQRSTSIVCVSKVKQLSPYRFHPGAAQQKVLHRLHLITHRARKRNWDPFPCKTSTYWDCTRCHLPTKNLDLLGNLRFPYCSPQFLQRLLRGCILVRIVVALSCSDIVVS